MYLKSFVSIYYCNVDVKEEQSRLITRNPHRCSSYRCLGDDSFYLQLKYQASVLTFYVWRLDITIHYFHLKQSCWIHLGRCLLCRCTTISERCHRPRISGVVNIRFCIFLFYCFIYYRLPIRTKTPSPNFHFSFWIAENGISCMSTNYYVGQEQRTCVRNIYTNNVRLHKLGNCDCWLTVDWQ